jgi:hypothetical protein
MGELSNIEKSTGIEITVFKKPDRTFYGHEIKLQELNRSQLDFIESINYMQIHEIEKNQLLEMVFIIVSNNLRAMQSKMIAKDQVLLVNDLIYELNTDFHTLTIKEVELVIKNGIRGKYETDTRGLSVVNFNFWAREYLDRKMKMNLEIQKKLDRKIKEEDPKPVTKESTLDILRAEWKMQKEKYDALPEKEKAKITFDNYWLKNGNQISSKYLFSQLKKFGLIDEKEVEAELGKMKKTNHISDVVKRMEIERRIICKLALDLRDANNQSNEYS